jgi:hypothetical protein
VSSGTTTADVLLALVNGAQLVAIAWIGWQAQLSARERARRQVADARDDAARDRAAPVDPFLTE